MVKKSDAFKCYKQYEVWIETQHAAKIKHLQTDQGGEYLSHEFTMHLKSKGTVRSLTGHDTPEENGVAIELDIARTCTSNALCH